MKELSGEEGWSELGQGFAVVTEIRFKFYIIMFLHKKTYFRKFVRA